MDKEKTVEPTDKKPVLPKKLKTINQSVSFGVGLAVSLSLLFIGGHAILFAIKLVNEGFYAFLTVNQFPYVVFWLILILIVYKSVFLAGFCVVEKNHSAVISFFDRRIPYKLLEGKYWLPPGIITAEQIDMRLKDIVWEIKFLSSDKALLACRIVLQYMVYGELEYLSTQPGVIDNGLKEIGEGTVSAYGGENKFDIAINDPNSSNKLKELFEEALEKVEGHGLYLAPWGIIVKQVIAGQILPADPKIIELLSAIKAEDLQKIAEDKNTKTSITNINKYVKKLGMTPKEAAIYHQKERGISTKEIVITSNSETTGFEKAEAMKQAKEDLSKDEQS
jgi:regulator of protease activity HflC (stomatin/prohibitin superfamily)